MNKNLFLKNLCNYKYSCLFFFQYFMLLAFLSKIYVIIFIKFKLFKNKFKLKLNFYHNIT